MSDEHDGEITRDEMPQRPRRRARGEGKPARTARSTPRNLTPGPGAEEAEGVLAPRPPRPAGRGGGRGRGEAGLAVTPAGRGGGREARRGVRWTPAARRAPAEEEVPQPAPAPPEAVALAQEFAAEQPFPLDPFQVEACEYLADGRSVLVAAPTGTGKTVVAELAIWLARRAGKRAIYTAPLKALSNQKFRDLRARYGEGQVGLLTGDIVEHPRAPIMVMTTEIYRNMLLEGLRASATLSPADEAEQLLAPVVHRTTLHSRAARAAQESGDAAPADDVAALARSAALDEELSTVACVVFDELHYLSEPQRGPVWEEAIIHSPPHVQLVGLSATVSNAGELRRWIEAVHGPTELVFTTARAVPLEHYFFVDGVLHLVQNAQGRRVARFPGIGGEAKLARRQARWRRYVTEDEGEDEQASYPVLRDLLARRQGDGPHPPAPSPARRGGVGTDNAEGAEGRGGRGEGEGTTAPSSGRQAGAQEGETAGPLRRQAPEPGEVLTALRQAELLPCLYFFPGRRAVETAAEGAKGHLLVSPEDRARLAAEVKEWVDALPADDRKLDQVQRLAALLPRGLAFHHAGLLPGLKVMVETLFQRGELKAVFATDTLALGINMPARSVALGSLSKFDGVQMRLLTPNEYQQLTGRAGRRGIDVRGAAVIPYSPWESFEEAFALLTAPLLPVTSAFTVRYNSVLNLWTPHHPERLRLAVAASFREFQRRAARHVEHGVSRSGQRSVGASGGRPHAEAEAEAQQGRYRLSRAAAAELEGTIYVLRHLGYIGRDDELTVKGRLLRAIFHPAGMVLTELIVNGTFEDLNAAEVAEVISWFTFDDDRPLRNYDQLSQRLLQARREVYNALRDVLGVESEESLQLSPGIVESFHGVALSWHRGYSLGGLLRRVDLAEGDLLVTLNQTIDLLQQVQGAIGQVLDARDLWRDVSPDTRFGRWMGTMRERLERLRPLVDAGWRGMLRGSVAQSRAIPSIAVTAKPTPDLPAIPMAEDEDPELARSDRVELGTPPAEMPPTEQPPEQAEASTAAQPPLGQPGE
ncbi:MAG TPA: DEAD/DEAH box helicase [Ktedonobacterales bacterium]